MGVRTQTVAQLRALLEDYDDDQLVAFSCDYGDRTHTEQVIPIEGFAELKLVGQSGYSDSGWAVVEEPDAEERELEDYREPQEILIIE